MKCLFGSVFTCTDCPGSPLHPFGARSGSGLYAWNWHVSSADLWKPSGTSEHMT